MTHITRRTFTRRVLPVLLLVVAATMPMVLPGVLLRSGVETYATSAFTSCGTAQNGGQYDEQKRLYMACGTNVRIQQANGTWANRALGVTATDVAPSPTGAYLYVTAGGGLFRFNRRADGTYRRDTVWKLPKITASWAFAPVPVAVSTDANGFLYVSHNVPADNVVTRHKPDGTQVAWIGGYSNQGEVGKFHLNRGVASSRDGKYIYVVDKSGGRIHRFDYQVDGTYKPSIRWGRVDQACGNGNFAAPGDVVVDPWGFVYIMDTTCSRAQKFTADGAFVWSKSFGAPVTNRSHRFAVDWRGSVYTTERAQKKLIRAAGTTPTAGMPAVQPLPQPPFSATTRAICPVEDWTNGAGQAAKDGTIYVACGHSVYVTEKDGTGAGRIALPAGAHYYDVAPSPDEAHLYVTRRVDAQGRPELRRLNRTGAAGSLTYTLDAAWKPANYTLGGTAWTPQGQFVATDVWGDIYYSVGGWAGYYTGAWDGPFQGEASPAIVIKYGPTGAIRTQFIGERSGEFDVNMGITVSRDGRSVWVVEHKMGRVQRFDHTANGEYHQTAAVWTFGVADAACAAPTALSTAYDLGADPWGGIWVANTGCRRADHFKPDGTRDQSVPLAGLLHGVAVDLDGNAWVGQRNIWIRRSAQNPVPGPVPVPQPLDVVGDAQGPVITALGVPNDGTVTTQTFDLTIAANDASQITKVRFENAGGTISAWLAFTSPFRFTTTPGYGAKYLKAQLMDEHGNEGAWVRRDYTYAAQVEGDVQGPVITDVVIPNGGVVTTQTFDLPITANDASAITKVRFENAGGTISAWLAFTSPFRFTTTPGYGDKYLKVQLMDVHGNVGAWVTRNYRYQAATTVCPPLVANGDTVRPVLRSEDVIVPDPTATSTINVQTRATDNVGVTCMRFVDDYGENWQPWIPYSANQQFTLRAGVGLRGVFVQVRDARGNWSEPPAYKQLTVVG